MYSATARYYDLIYTRFKNYTDESRNIAALIKTVHPQAKTILDVACGTGEHARILSEMFGYEVDGLDLEADFVSMAAAKNPRGNFYHADMQDFELTKKYEVVMCLFSSIGYAKTLDKVVKSLRCFRQHLAAKGIILVEPWFTPGILKDGQVTLKTVESGDVKLCRMSYIDFEGNISRIKFEYLLGQPDGIAHYAEIHELGLFTIDEMKSAFNQAGLKVEYDPEGIDNRGLYIGKI